MKEISSPRREWLLAALIIVATTAIRWWIVASGQLELVQDEAQYWDWTRHLQLSYYSKGPLVAWIISLGTALFGDTELGVRFGALAGSFLVQWAIWLYLARMLRRPDLGLLLLVIVNTMPLFMASGLLMTTDNPLLLCWVLGLICLHRATDGGKSAWAVPGLVLCMALGVLAKYMMLAFGAVAVMHLFLLYRAGALPRRTGVKVLGGVILGGVLGFLPILLWNMQNDFVGFRHVGALAGMGGSEQHSLLRLDTLPEFLGSQILLVTPWWLFFMLVGGLRALRRAWRCESAGGGADSTVSDSLFASAFWPVFLGFTLLSFRTQVYPNWPAVCYAGGVLLAARELSRLLARRKAGEKGTWGRMAWLWPVMGLVVYLGMHAVLWVDVLPESMNPVVRLRGWSDLGGEVSRMAQEDFQDPGKVFFFSDEYDITAALAFYVDGNPRTYCALHDRRMSQYDLWPGPQDRLGWDAIFVRKRFKDMNPQLASMFEHVENIPFQSTHRGHPGMRFTITRCYDFRGPWPGIGGNSF